MYLSTKIILGVIVVSFILSIIIDAVTKNFSLTSILTYLFGFVIYYLILLDQNCVHEGPCISWGWVKAAITIILFVILIIVKIYMLVNYSKTKPAATTTATTTDTKKEETKTT